MNRFPFASATRSSTLGRAIFEVMEARQLLSTTAAGASANAVAVDYVALSERLGVSETIAASWTNVADLTQYDANQISATANWAFAFPLGGSVGEFARRLGATVVESGVMDRVFIATFNSGDQAKATFSRIGIEDFYPLVETQQTSRFIPNDPLFSSQWHLRNTGQGGGTAGADVNADEAWDRFDSQNRRITGEGVVIGIVDDGVHYDHVDLNPHYRTDLDHNWNNGTATDGYAISSSDYHGTSVAGIAGAVGNNGTGVTGAAYNADITSLRLISGFASDLDESQALSWMNQTIDVYNNSWGPYDDGRRFEGPGPLTLAALQDTATNGRGGLGGIHTWAGGNGGNVDDSNRDGYANSRFTIAIGAVSDRGDNASYSEPGANLLAVTPSSSSGRQGTTTTSRSTGYTNSFGGTSSAAPLAAGVVGLMLQANPQLTYRDVQHIIVETSIKTDPNDATWQVNGAGYDVSDDYGFGLLDAAAAVDAAMNWNTVSAEVSASLPVQVVNRAIPDGNATGITETFTIADDLTIEHIELTVDIDHTYRGDLTLELTSPDGTVSTLLRANNDANDNINNWTLTSTQFWGESSTGEWKLTVRDSVNQDVGTLNNYSFRAFGTFAEEPPVLVSQSFLYETSHRFEMLFDSDVSASLDSGDLQFRNTDTNQVFAAEFLGSTVNPDGTTAALFGVASQAGTTATPSGPILPSGHYQSEIVGTIESAGGSLDNPSSLAFEFLQGDANRDGTVDLSDFVVLRNNFGSGSVFSQADFNYDGTVDLEDFVLLRNNFGNTL